MNYIVHYDVAALILLITVLVYYVYKKTISTNKTRIFFGLLWCGLLTTVLDILTLILFPYGSSINIGVNYLINILYYLSIYVLTPVIYNIYIIIAINNNRLLGLKNKLLFVPAIISALLIITTFYTKYIFYFENGIFMYGKYRNLLYVLAGFYVVISVIQTISNRNLLTRRQEASIYFFTVAIIVAIIVQAIDRSILLVQFAIAISILLIYLSLENPDDYSDKQLGIYNKLAFKEVYNEYIYNEKPFRVLVIKLEGVQYINEIMGSSSVDIIIKQVSDYLSTVSNCTKLFKLSDIKFALISDKEQLDWDNIIKMIVERFSKPFGIGGVQTALSEVMCMISYPDKLTCSENMPDMIEYSLEKAVTLGDDTVIYADETILEEGRREHKIIQVMRQALRNKTFEVYYQPIYSVEKGHYTSAEALIRLRDEELGFISPDEFITLAEKNGMILEIGEYVFREVCRFMSNKKIWEKGIEYIDVNLSVVQCMQEKLHEKLINIMDEYRIEYRYINLEITETAAIMSSETLQSNMEKLMAKGIKFSLDDYGIGFSNTSNLVKYSFHTIKLDKSMVWSAMEDEKAMCALEYTIGMVKAMNMQLVAEGVENEEQAEKLESMGCDFFQGYLYSRPICKEDFYMKISEQKI